MVLQNWVFTCNRVKFCPYHSHSSESTENRSKAEIVRPEATTLTLGKPSIGVVSDGQVSLEGSGSRSKRQLSCVQRRHFWMTETQAAVWIERLLCGKPDWASDTASMLGCTKDWTAKSFQSSQENELIVWLGFLKEGIQVVNKFIKECSKSLIVSKMKTEINEMYSHPSYMTFTWKTKDSKYYWECREKELLNAIY